MLSMEKNLSSPPLTLNTVRFCKSLIFLFFSKVHSRSKSNLGGYNVKTAASTASNDAP